MHIKIPSREHKTEKIKIQHKPKNCINPFELEVEESNAEFALKILSDYDKYMVENNIKDE